MARRFLATIWAGTALMLFVLLGGACSTGGDDAWSAESLGRAGDRLVPVVANSGGTLALGPNRITIALFDRDGTMVHDADEVTLGLYRLDGDSGVLATETPLRRTQLEEEGAADPLVTLYVADVEFDRPEWWGAEVSASVDGGRVDSARARFFVSEASSAPAIGAAPPAAAQPVLEDSKDVTAICSAGAPRPELHAMTVREAIESGQPTVIALATPRFCTTRYCGPVLEDAVWPVADRYGDRVNVLHVEPFDLAQAQDGRLVPIAMLEDWGLESEPWVFVLDAQGRLAARFEGVVTADELVAVLDRLLGG